MRSALLLCFGVVSVPYALGQTCAAGDKACLAASCSDSDERCAGWAGQGECENNEE